MFILLCVYHALINYVQVDADIAQSTRSIFNTDLGSKEKHQISMFIPGFGRQKHGRKIKKILNIKRCCIGIKFYGRHGMEITNSRK